MENSGLDKAFWAMAEPLWSELAAKPIIMSEPSHHPHVRGVARILIKNGEVGDRTRGFVQRRLARDWDLRPEDVNHLIEMQVDHDREEVSVQLKRKGIM